eukprot:1927056-Rhodomonas_salina.1
MSHVRQADSALTRMQKETDTQNAVLLSLSLSLSRAPTQGDHSSRLPTSRSTLAGLPDEGLGVGVDSSPLLNRAHNRREVVVG